MPSEIHVKRNKALHIRLFLIAVVGLVFSVLYYLIQLANSSLTWMIITSVIALLFIFVLVTSSRMLLNRKPALSLTNEGIVDSISLASAGTIPWKEVKSVRLETYLNSPQILIALHHPEKILENLGYVKKRMVNQQLVDTGAVIVINPKMIQGKPQDIVNNIKRRARV